jgi:hypothetical protein
VEEDAGRGVYATIDDLAKSKGKTYVSQVLRLTLLAPEIVQAILDGRQPAELPLEDLLDVFPLEWEEQGKFGGSVLRTAEFSADRLSAAKV